MDQTCLPAIVIHGGAWSIPEDLSEASRRGAIEAARKGYQVLKEGGSAVDAVQTAVVYLEDDPAFLAGTSVILNICHGGDLMVCPHREIFYFLMSFLFP